jgi:tetratricopeptide (TPR) repeat protein
MPVLDNLLVSFRRWTHEAVISGHWERSASTQHEKARHVSRHLASDLQAGLKYMEQGKESMAWMHWNSATRRFTNPDLFNTWYHETPIRLLFEIARIKESGHPQFAAKLLTMTGNWATARLKPDDVRHALYSTYGQIEVDKIRYVYEQAARFMLDGLASRLEKDDPLLFEVRLNRALDMSYFDETVDLSEWLPPLEEVDETMGTKNSFCVYYLLLQAYQLVARGEPNAADKKVSEARRRIDSLPPGGIDQYKLGMAYRRLGRMQYQRENWQDAKRSFNQAWRLLKTGKHADGLMIEVLQCQLSLALATDDIADVDIFRKALADHEHKIQVQERQEIENELARGGGMGEYAINGHVGTIPEGVMNGADVPSIKVDSPAPFENGKLDRLPALAEER